MKLIVAADNDWGIGRNGGLLVHVRGDLLFFKEMTMGHTLVMGRTTLESLPGGRPLPGRKTIVLTRNSAYEAPCEKLGSVDELLSLIDNGQLDSDDIFVAGGADIYNQLLPYCDTLYVTKLLGSFDADRFMPDLDSDPELMLVESGDIQTENGISYRFDTYKRKEKTE